MNVLKGILICMIILLVGGFLSWAYIHGLCGVEPDPDAVELMKNWGCY